jgi:hypothetical protein
MRNIKFHGSFSGRAALLANIALTDFLLAQPGDAIAHQ